MLPIIEHSIRTGYLQKTLKLPFSLFLKSPYNKNIIVTFNKLDPNNDKIVVKYWHLNQIKENAKFPPNKKVIIDKKDIFNISLIIIGGFYPIDYKIDVYDHSTEPEEIDTQQWIENEQEEYKEIMKDIFFSTEHKMYRESILWKAFIDKFIPSNQCIKYMFFKDQQCIVKNVNARLWDLWDQWKKRLLECNNQVAPELCYFINNEESSEINF